MTTAVISSADDVCPYNLFQNDLLLTSDKAKQNLAAALNLIEAVSTSFGELLDNSIRKRINSLCRQQVQFSPYALLQEPRLGLKDDDIKKLSPYCHKLEAFADFDDVLAGLEAQLKYENVLLDKSQGSTKGQLINSILSNGPSRAVRNSIASVLDVIGSLALLRIREIEAQAQADLQHHTFITTEDCGSFSAVIITKQKRNGWMSDPK
jgi:hypothetical protein